MRDEVTLYLGPPGTGKTTTLLNRVKGFLEAGVEPNRIAYVSFTRKAAQEVKSRISRDLEMFDSRDFPHFNTLHAEAFMLMGLDATQVMKDEDYAELGETLGWADFKVQYGNSMERMAPSAANGDRCMFIYQFAKSRRISIKDAYLLVRDYELDYEHVVEFVEKLEQYKKQRFKLDFTDFIERCQGNIDIDVMIIDEAQDLTPQQWAYAKRLGAKAKHIIIAGDDDQSIYEWSGAHIDHFMNIKAERIVLPKSYRLPRMIYSVCNDVLDKINMRIPKQWQPDDRTGSYQQLYGFGELKLHEGDWLLLARNNYQLDQYAKACEEQGVPYRLNGVESNSRGFIQAVVTYYQLFKGFEITATKLRNLYYYIYGKNAPKVEGGERYTLADCQFPFEGKPEWYKVMTQMNERQVNYVRGLLINGQSLTKKAKVEISTIHAAKGGEATNVVVHPAMSRRVYAGYQEQPDAEHRVWYVAASRAKENLFIAPCDSAMRYEYL